MLSLVRRKGMVWKAICNLKVEEGRLQKNWQIFYNEDCEGEWEEESAIISQISGFNL